MSELITLARPYAKAAFETAKAHNDLQVWSDSLRLLSIVASDNRVSELIGSPLYTAKQQCDFLHGLTEFSDGVKHLVSVLAKNKRLPLIPSVAKLFELLKQEAEQSANAVVTAAKPLSDSQVRVLTEKLSAHLNKNISVEVNEDPDLLGGLVIQCGDWVLDSSLRGKLSKMSESLIG